MTARLTSGDRRVDFTIIGYEHRWIRGHQPPIDGDLQANALEVVVSATNGDGQWRARGRLENWHVVRLAEWIEFVVDGGTPFWGFGGTAAFELNESREWLDVAIRSDGWPRKLRFPARADILRRFATELKAEVAQFPLRTVEAHGEARRQALRFRALDGMPVATLSARMLPAFADQLVVQAVRTRARSLSWDLYSDASQDGLLSSRILDTRPPNPAVPEPPPFSAWIASPGEMRVIFWSAVDAIDASLRYRQRAMDADVPVKIGVHWGAVERDLNDHVGGAADVASEIAQYCKPGRVLASEVVCELLWESSALDFEEFDELARDRSLEPMRLYDVSSPIAEAPDAEIDP